MKYISAFDSKTLHDETNRWSKTPLAATKKAQTEVARMANGTLFDPNYGTGSNVTPEPFTARFLFKFSTEAAAENERISLEGKLGDNGTLTASFTSGATAQTCNATLDNVQFEERANGRNFIATCFFIPFTEWS